MLKAINELFKLTTNKAKTSKKFDVMLWNSKKATFITKKKKRRKTLWRFIDPFEVKNMLNEMMEKCPHWHLESFLNIPVSKDIQALSKKLSIKP